MHHEGSKDSAPPQEEHYGVEQFIGLQIVSVCISVSREGFAACKRQMGALPLGFQNTREA